MLAICPRVRVRWYLVVLLRSCV